MNLYAPGPNDAPLGPPALGGACRATPRPRGVFAGMPSWGRNEADEMNLYAPGQDDAPFGPADLEWLYRKHDSDGSSLDSRLARLAPVSFTHPLDSPRRPRRGATATTRPPAARSTPGWHGWRRSASPTPLTACAAAVSSASTRGRPT